MTDVASKIAANSTHCERPVFRLISDFDAILHNQQLWAARRSED
jgi:hypothetical protein